MEVAFSLTVHGKRLDVAGLKRSEDPSSLYSIEFMENLNPKSKFLGPIRQYSISNKEQLEEIRLFLHQAVDSLLDGAIASYNIKPE